MRRATIVWVVMTLAISAAAVAGCDGDVRLKDDDNGTSVTLANGEALELVLTSNPTTGYSWSAVEVPACLDQDGEPEYDSDALPGMVGAGGEDTWRFVGAEPGEGTLRLEYKKSWEGEVEAVQVYEIDVTVE
ncbi:MAG: protease inhibitor I42 family protein [Coriobacteriia bacterium]|nr:protease inhibitor I42 family protein [Coriobacteriia bacterium]